MATESSIRSKVRNALGDKGTPFQVTFQGDGETVTVKVPYDPIDGETLKVYKIVSNTLTYLTSPTDYTIDLDTGTLFIVGAPLPENVVLYVEGKAWSLFTDEELNQHIRDAIIQHCHGSEMVTRYRDDHGFIKYRTVEKDLTNLPEVEDVLIGVLATVEALWELSTDASLDIDIASAEGTRINRGQRYKQIRSQIDLLTEKYNDMAKALNVGLYRVEMGTLRRVSRTTGRLVPVFVEREYDSTDLPQRLLPPIDKPDIDDSGVPSPLFGGLWGY